MGRGGQGGYERRIEIFVKIKKNRRWGGGGGRVLGEGKGGCERRIEVFVKIPKNIFRGGGGGRVVGGVRVDVNEELEFL